MSLIELAAIRARHLAWYNEAPEEAEWPDRDDDESMEFYIARNDVPALLDAVFDGLHAAYGSGFDEGFKAGYEDRSAELADQPLGVEG